MSHIINIVYSNYGKILLNFRPNIIIIEKLKSSPKILEIESLEFMCDVRGLFCACLSCDVYFPYDVIYCKINKLLMKRK